MCKRYRLGFPCGSICRSWGYCDKSTYRNKVAFRVPSHHRSPPPYPCSPGDEPCPSLSSRRRREEEYRAFVASSRQASCPTKRGRTPLPTSRPRIRVRKEHILLRERVPCSRRKKVRIENPHVLKCPNPDCDYERVGRVWACCMCGGGPNRHSTCDSEIDQDISILEECGHSVCENCQPYEFPPVPVFSPAVGDWVVTPTGSDGGTAPEIEAADND
ncbi:hypothetical protein B0T25DRAFT_577561 [Lasiosphaeria hispida]|uniref:Uncharacterized protein n=1 Tax=Lasiosphaeria hispida TaxID=260671 RepID=A0AAJ0HQ85_9PEZI|nr:hypothetical protein B0T25DRAFT_577561 [Lasiosphaeria hispida]